MKKHDKVYNKEKGTMVQKKNSNREFNEETFLFYVTSSENWIEQKKREKRQERGALLLRKIVNLDEIFFN